MAKDTEKLIRQLSLISYLMAERRPVTALEIRRDVEGYSGMNEDAFARRFYADRAELESLRIQLTVERPSDGAAEQESYSLRPENFHLRPIAFTDKELAALQTALSLLDGEFAYAEPLRLALQQITWGRPSPLAGPEQSSVALGITASAGGQLGEERDVAEILIGERIAWQVERHFGRYGEVREPQDGEQGGSGDRIFRTPYSDPRTIVSWVLGLGPNARLLGPAELTREYQHRLKLLKQRHGRGAPAAGGKGAPRARASSTRRAASAAADAPAAAAGEGERDGSSAAARGEQPGARREAAGDARAEAAIRPER